MDNIVFLSHRKKFFMILGDNEKQEIIWECFPTQRYILVFI